ncbi:MAG: peroxiredoxin [Gammaproteobacteria bacterium]
MKKFIKHTSLLIFKSLFLIGHANAADELTIGSIAPDFNLKDQNYQDHKLADYKGQWLVVYFYPKDDTPGCTKEACNFRDDIFKIKALNGVVLGISLDDSKSHEEFAKKYSLPFSLLADTDGKVSETYNALTKFGPIKFSKRHSFIIGPDGIIKKVYRSVDTDRHSQQIIDDLTSLIKTANQ